MAGLDSPVAQVATPPNHVGSLSNHAASPAFKTAATAAVLPPNYAASRVLQAAAMSSRAALRNSHPSLSSSRFLKKAASPKKAASRVSQSAAKLNLNASRGPQTSNKPNQLSVSRGPQASAKLMQIVSRVLHAGNTVQNSALSVRSDVKHDLENDPKQDLESTIIQPGKDSRKIKLKTTIGD